MAVGHLLDSYSRVLAAAVPRLEASRTPLGALARLGVMNTHPRPHEPVEPVLTVSELAAALAVNAQTLYDLRSKGRDPRGFRVGRELRFRRSEIEGGTVWTVLSPGPRRRRPPVLDRPCRWGLARLGLMAGSEARLSGLTVLPITIQCDRP